MRGHAYCHHHGHDRGTDQEEAIHDGGDDHPVRVVCDGRPVVFHLDRTLVTARVHVDLIVTVPVVGHLYAATLRTQPDYLQWIWKVRVLFSSSQISPYNSNRNTFI